MHFVRFDIGLSHHDILPSFLSDHFLFPQLPDKSAIKKQFLKYVKSFLLYWQFFLCVAFYELLGICVAYKKQPEVSNTTKKETKNGSWNECSENTERAVIIEKNPEALLQRVRLIKNAKKEIILSTFAFQSDESGKLILGALHDAADMRAFRRSGKDPDRL